MKKLFITGVAFIGIAALVLLLARDAIAWRLFDRTLEQRLGRNVVSELPDGLHVGLAGSGGPMPNRDRGAASVFVIAGQDLFVIDAGSRAAGTMGTMGVPVGQIEAIFLTHFHSDHIDGLGELMMNRWVMDSNNEPVPVYGPEGVDRVVNGLKEAYALDSKYRTAHHGEDVAPPSGASGTPIAFSLSEDALTPVLVYEKENLKITAFPVDHEPIHPSVAYRFEYKGRSVVISGDTAPTDLMIHHGKDADVLVHEVLQREMVSKMQNAAETAGMDKRAKIMFDIQDYHTSPKEAAEIAEEAGVRHLLLYHVVPSVPAFMERVYLGDAGDSYSGEITLGNDGDLISLPAASSDVKYTNLL